MLLKNEEIAKLKVRSQYEDNDWIIPPFTLRGKELNLPKLNGRNIMEKEKEERDLHILDETGGTNGYYRSTGGSEDESENIPDFKDDKKRGRTVIRQSKKQDEVN